MVGRLSEEHTIYWWKRKYLVYVEPWSPWCSLSRCVITQVDTFISSTPQRTMSLITAICKTLRTNKTYERLCISLILNNRSCIVLVRDLCLCMFIIQCNLLPAFVRQIQWLLLNKCFSLTERNGGGDIKKMLTVSPFIWRPAHFFTCKKMAVALITQWQSLLWFFWLWYSSSVDVLGRAKIELYIIRCFILR